jgi:phage repressor protein C with HTH and peptisase S24 domain
MDNDEIIELSIKYLLESKESNYKIGKATGISDNTIGRYRKGSKPTPANAKLLLQYFDGSLPTFESNARILEDFDFMNIPLVPIHAQAGYGKGYGDQEYIDNLPTIPVIVDKNYRGKYRVFEVSGDSMDDGTRQSLCHGDKVLGREVMPQHWTTKLHFHDWFFIIVMRNDGVLIKQIVEHDLENHTIKCHSLNSLYEDFTVDLSEVAELYNVIKMVDRNTRI